MHHEFDDGFHNMPILEIHGLSLTEDAPATVELNVRILLDDDSIITGELTVDKFLHELQQRYGVSIKNFEKSKPSGLKQHEVYIEVVYVLSLGNLTVQQLVDCILSQTFWSDEESLVKPTDWSKVEFIEEDEATDSQPEEEAADEAPRVDSLFIDDWIEFVDSFWRQARLRSQEYDVSSDESSGGSQDQEAQDPTPEPGEPGSNLLLDFLINFVCRFEGHVPDDFKPNARNSAFDEDTSVGRFFCRMRDGDYSDALVELDRIVVDAMSKASDSGQSNQ